MKTLFPLLLFLTLGLTPLQAVAQYADISSNQLYRTDEERYGHLEYFGFYASAMGGWNYTQEIASFTNLTWIHVGSGDEVETGIEQMMERLRQARTAGVSATLSIESFLFRNEEGELRPEQQIIDFLVELRARIEFEGLLDTLAMIYPKDEPYRNFIDARDPNFIEQYITGEVYEEVYADLYRANQQVKLVFPEKPIGVILSGYEVFNRFLAIPENYDWVGFDCYDNLFESCDDRSFVEHYSKLLELMQPHQRLIAVPETWVQNDDMELPDWPDVLLRRFRHHYEIALNEPRFIAFVPFLWSFDATTPVPGLGLNRIAELFDDGLHDQGTAFVNEVKAVGRQIKAGQPEFPNMAYHETEPVIQRPPENIRGGIMSISNGGLVSAWASDDALPHKNLRVQILVRNHMGSLIHKSRIDRTFVHDPGLSGDAFIGQSFVGLQGYRYQLPEALVKQTREHEFTLEWVVFADGEAMDVGFHNQVTLGGGTNPPPVARRWIGVSQAGDEDSNPYPPFPPPGQRESSRSTE